MKVIPQETSRAELPHVSSSLLKLFSIYTRGYAHRHFHTFRILKTGLPPRDLARSRVIFLNHTSWWDPLVCLLLSREFLPYRTSFAPIEGSMLKRYRFFKHLGFFGVEQMTAIGARKFLNTMRAILASPRNAVWITPQGRFMDVRQRPLRLQSGLGALAKQSKNTIFLPLAIEYTFWNEPRPEILVAFGEPIISSSEASGSAEEWTKRFSDALEQTQDELAAHSVRRDPGDWVTLNRGKSGVNSIYDSWRWLRARISRQEFVRERRAEVMR
ncbi:MAG TPA: lysophospholipid acyltransferase family protein [Chthoniobacterales bacterium]|nr:lysophospholipid acyltransferase family protein [Chthoniobacterales bacterium]